MKESVNKAIKVTNGKKTESVGLLMVAFQALMLLKPDLITSGQESAINLIIGSGVVSTLAHRIYRNRKEIAQYSKNKFKWLKTALKSFLNKKNNE